MEEYLPMLERIVQTGSVVGLMTVIIWWLLNKVKGMEDKVNEKDQEIKFLNEMITKSEKENLKILINLNQTLDKLIDSHKEVSEKLIDNNKNHNENINEKIKLIKEMIEGKVDMIMNQLDK